MSKELISPQGYAKSVRAFLTAGLREQALVAFAELMCTHPSSAETRALLVELFAVRVDGDKCAVGSHARGAAARDV